MLSEFLHYESIMYNLYITVKSIHILDRRALSNTSRNWTNKTIPLTTVHLKI